MLLPHGHGGDDLDHHVQVGNNDERFQDAVDSGNSFVREQGPVVVYGKWQFPLQPGVFCNA